MFCRTCNREVEGNPEYCPFCGSRLNARDHNVGKRVAHRSVNNTLAMTILYGIMLIMSMIAFICGAKRSWVAMIFMGITTVAFIINLVITIIELKNLEYYVKNYHFSDRKAKIIWIVGIALSGVLMIVLWVLTAIGSKAGSITVGILEMLVCGGAGTVSFLVWNKTRNQTAAPAPAN